MSRSIGSIGFDLAHQPPYNSAVREWNLAAGDPISLRLAADARISTPNYVDDQIWELRLGGGEPNALALQTTYGLRARSMRIFPGFRLGDETWLAPERFHAPPTLLAFLPNYLRLRFEPVPALEVVAEYWVPESNLIGGRFTLRNNSAEPMQPWLLLHALLHPGDQPQSVSSLPHQGAIVLQGKTGNLAPVIFLAGGAQAAIAPYPALAVKLILAPESSEAFGWAHAACAEVGESFQLARDLVARNWDAELARVEQLNAGWIELETGEPEWDVALAMSQKVSLAGYVGPTRYLPRASAVLTRSPDAGFSPNGDGRDYDPGWAGLSAGEAYLNIAQILPCAPDLARGVLLDFLASQSPDGSVDAKPGLGGQRSGWLSLPLLSTLALRVYQHTEDRQFLEEVHARLAQFVEAWFDRRHDRDQDGVPEWDHALQSGFDDWPAFNLWNDWGQGLDISSAETPDLACYLLREIESLAEIERILGRLPSADSWERHAHDLRTAVERSWSARSSCYLAVDRDLHQALEGIKLGGGKGEFTLQIERQFDPPVRVLARVEGPPDIGHKLHLFIHGRGRTNRKRVESLTDRKFHWFGGIGTFTTERNYSQIDRIEVRNLSSKFKLAAMAPDYSRCDQTGFLPLWAGIPSASRAAQLVDRTLLDPHRFWRKHGIPACPANDPAYAADRPSAVWMQWNTMIGEGLVDYGYLHQAAELVSRLMRACTESLKQDQGFRQAYHADGAGGIGERDHLAGVAPLGLLLYVLGVRLISPRKIALRGLNPFPWPIRLSWRGLEIEWEQDSAWVTFPSGERAEVAGSSVQVVEQL